MADTSVNPQAFKDMIVSKYPDGVSADGTRYADMDPVKLTQSVVSKYPDGVTNAGVKYSDYLNQGGDQPQSSDVAPTWFPASSDDSPLTAGLKTAGNLIPSTINTGAGILQSALGLPGQMLNVASTANDTGNIYNDAEDRHKAVIQGMRDVIMKKRAEGYDTRADEKVLADTISMGVAERGSEFLKAIPGAALTTAEGIFPFLKPALAGDLGGVSQSIENNPVGNVLPVVTAAEGGIRGLADRGVIPSSVADTVDTGISKTAQLVTKPVGAVSSFVGEKLADAARFGTSQATGLEPSTIRTITENPEAFTKKASQDVSRLSVARQVENGLQTRINDLSETGKAYAPIRKSVAPVRVDPNYLTDLFQKNTGLTVQETPMKPSEKGVIQMEPETTTPGKLTTSPNATIRDSGDVARLQKIYNTYQPLFESGQMTPNEFLNLRSDLADAANYESKNGKSAPVEAAADRMRGQLNSTYREQIPGLETIDNSFSGQITELNDLKKGLLDNNGNLTDTAINRIANATGRGKDLLLARLEEIVPGITKKIQIVKALEDIEHAGGPKVGTYARSTAGPLGMIGIFTGNVPLAVAGITEAIISSPKIALPILRSYGFTSEIVSGVISQLKNYLNPNMSGPRTLPFLPRSNSQITNPSTVQ